jgi:hypothetical protein
MTHILRSTAMGKYFSCRQFEKSWREWDFAPMSRTAPDWQSRCWPSDPAWPCWAKLQATVFILNLLLNLFWTQSTDGRSAAHSIVRRFRAWPSAALLLLLQQSTTNHAVVGRETNTHISSPKALPLVEVQSKPTFGSTIPTIAKCWFI